MIRLFYLFVLFLPFISPAHALEDKASTDNPTCDRQIIKLEKEVDNIFWGPNSYGPASGTITYRDGTYARVKAEFTGFCGLPKPLQQSHSGWDTQDEKGLPSLVERSPGDQLVNDTNGDSTPGLEKDVASFFGELSGRTKRHNHYPMGRGYHLTRFAMLTNVGAHLRYIDLPPNRVFMSRQFRILSITLGKKVMSLWGQALIEADVEKGPRLAIYGYYDRRLRLLAHTPWHGDKKGWINLVSAGQLDRDLATEHLTIRDPQEEGRMELWELQPSFSPHGTPFKLVKKDERSGFTNHMFGTRSNWVQVIALLNRDFSAEVILPSKGRKRLHIFSAEGEKLTDLGTIDLPLPVVDNMSHVFMYDKDYNPITKLIVPLADNTIRLIDVPPISVPASKH